MQEQATERLHMEIPHVAVQLLGPGDLTTGTATSYEVLVRNPDRIGLAGLILRMETPPGVEVAASGPAADSVDLEKADDGATLVTWNVDQVAPGGTARLPLELKATAARNFAVAIEWTVLPQAGINEIIVKQAELQVALEGPVEVDKDVPNVYRLRVSNPGNAMARNVKVDVIAGNQPASQVEVGDLAAGQSEIVEMDLTFEKAGKIAIGAHGVADGSLEKDTNISVNVRQAIVQAGVVTPPNVPHGSSFVATIELKNSGDGAARNLQAGLMLPAKTEVIELPSGVTRQGDKLLWNVDQLAAGEAVTLPIELLLSTPGQHELKFACVAATGAVTSAHCTTTVEAFADLKLQVNDPPSPSPLGAPVTYELTITNRGSREARDVLIVTQFSEGIEPESAAGLKHRVVPGQVLFDSLPSIAAGESIHLKVVAKAAVPGMHRFRAEVRCEENEARLVEEGSTRFLDAPARIAAPANTKLQR